MAAHTHIMGAPTRATLLSNPASPIGEILSRYVREQLHAFVTIAIDLLDAAGPDPVSELEEDRCDAGDDQIIGGPVSGREWWRQPRPGDDSDAESDRQPIQHRLDQTHPLLEPYDP